MTTFRLITSNEPVLSVDDLSTDWATVREISSGATHIATVIELPSGYCKVLVINMFGRCFHYDPCAFDGLYTVEKIVNKLTIT